MSALAVLVLHILFLHIEKVWFGLRTHFKALADKKENKVVIAVFCWLKSYDDAVLIKWCQIRKRQIEAIIVTCEFEQLNKFLPLGERTAAKWLSWKY